MIQDVLTICRVLFEVIKMIFGILLFLVLQGLCFIFLSCIDLLNQLFVKILRGLKL